VTSEQQLREKLRKITALYEGAATPGERQAAAAAIERVRQVLKEAAQEKKPLPETVFRLADEWQRRLFLALCRRYGLSPFRYKGQRRNTVIVRAPTEFVNSTLWPEYQQLYRELNAYLSEATERIIREEVFGDVHEARAKARGR
jgi:hypothetical protein